MTNPHPTPASYPVVIPKLGLTMLEASVLEWYAKDGEWVEKGQPLFAIENEKASVDIESPASGYLHILAPTGVVLPVLTVIAEISPQPISAPATEPLPQPAKIASPEGPASASAAAQTATVAPTAPPTRPPATPKARRLAQELNLPLEELHGSGIRSMITAADVRRQAETLRRRASPLAEKVAAAAGLDLRNVQGSGSHGRILRRDVEAALQSSPLPAQPQPAPSQRLSGLRAVIAERLSAAWQERPQVTLFCEANAVQLMQAYRQLNQALAAAQEKVSLNALFIKLCAIALLEHPQMNALLENGQIIQPDHVNIGLAVDTERGLVVPVVQQAEAKPLHQIHRELAELIQRALQNRSTPQDLEGGTFSITNLGMYDIDGFTPIINPPQTAILGIGRIRPKPAEENGTLVMREQVTLSLSFDHRLVDGAPAARFLQRIKHLVEHPFLLAW